MAVFDDVASIVALVVSLLAIAGFLIARRKVAVDEGKHLEAVRRLGEDLGHAYAKIHELEAASHERDVVTAEIKADVKHLLEAVARIEGKLDGHILGTPA
jgi:hypothetical protein